jgi:hypothetical protein
LKHVVIFWKHSELAHGALQKLHLAHHSCAGELANVKMAASTFWSQTRGVSDGVRRLVVHMYGNRHLMRMRLILPW